MLNKKKSKQKTTQLDTLIGQQTHIRGDVHFSGGLRVDGRVTGSIIASDQDNGLLTLSEKGSVQGDLRVPQQVINGTIEGDVYASEHVELAPQARINGNVYYRLLKMSEGAAVNGQLIHSEDKPEETLSVEHEVFDTPDNPQLDNTV